MQDCLTDISQQTFLKWPVTCRQDRLLLPVEQAFIAPIGTISIEVERPASGRVRVWVLHPNAETNHSRGVSRYDFRRFGALIRSVRLGVPAAPGQGGSPGVGGHGLAWRLRNMLNR